MAISDTRSRCFQETTAIVRQAHEEPILWKDDDTYGVHEHRYTSATCSGQEGESVRERCESLFQVLLGQVQELCKIGRCIKESCSKVLAGAIEKLEKQVTEGVWHPRGTRAADRVTILSWKIMDCCC